jgi:hypothetical protein
MDGCRSRFPNVQVFYYVQLYATEYTCLVRSTPAFTSLDHKHCVILGLATRDYLHTTWYMHAITNYRLISKLVGHLSSKKKKKKKDERKRKEKR